MDASHSPASNSREDRWARLVQDRGFHAIAEIGVWKGAFARALLDSCPDISTYWMIDPWRRLPRWNKPFNVSDEEFEAVYREALAATESHAAVRRVLRGTTAEVIDQIPDGSLDFAYIDGDHTLRGITLDLLLVWPKIRAGGAIGGDDCCPTAWQHGLAYEPTMVSPWVAYFAEAMRASITILPDNQFLIEKRSDGFTLTDQSDTVREWSVRAHFGSSMGPLRGTERGAAFRAINAIKRCTVGAMRRASPAFCEWDSGRRFGAFPREIRDAGHLFIHVPKAAGTSFSLALYGRSFGHQTLAEWQTNYPRSTAGMPTIAIVRDPVDRFLSAFRYLKKGGMNAADAEFARRTLGSCDTASDFARALLTPTTQKLALTTGFHFRRQVDFLRDRAGAVAIDHLIPFERLDNAPGRMQKILDRPFQLPAVNRSASSDSDAYSLDDEARRIVEAIYEEDGRLHRDALWNDSADAARDGASPAH
jgi:hypothetical protein